MTTQPEALRLADLIDERPDAALVVKDAAAELRRLHEVNQELLEALKEAADEIADWGLYASEYFQNKHDLQGAINKARAAIAKAEEKA